MPLAIYRALKQSQSKRVRVKLKLNEIGVKLSEIAISLFRVANLHQRVSYISFGYYELYSTLQLLFYYSLEPLVEDLTGGMVWD